VGSAIAVGVLVAVVVFAALYFTAAKGGDDETATGSVRGRDAGPLALGDGSENIARLAAVEGEVKALRARISDCEERLEHRWRILAGRVSQLRGPSAEQFEEESTPLGGVQLQLLENAAKAAGAAEPAPSAAPVAAGRRRIRPRR
jgi:hypothetical protein